MYLLSSAHYFNKCNQLILKRFGGTIPVILISNLENKGVKGDIIKVKRGYARNFLIPRQIAGTIIINKYI